MADSTPTGIEKRPRGNPTGQTLSRPRKRIPLRDREADIEVPIRCLAFSAEPPRQWSEEEIKALVEFVLFHGTREHWPIHKLVPF